MQIRRLTASFEGLNSSLAQSASELQSCEVVWKEQLVRDFKVRVYCKPAIKVLKSN